MITPMGFLRWATIPAIVLTVLQLLLLQTPAVASGGGDGCNPLQTQPSRTSNYLHWYFSGTDDDTSGSSYGGIYGDIYEYSPWVYNSSNSTDGPDATAQWVMLDNPGYNEWAQDGWIEWPASSRDVFVEFNDPGHNSWDNYFPAFDINSTIDFKVTYNPACTPQCFAFYDNGSSTPLTTSALNWTPTDTESFAETHDQASQMPGGYDNATSASNLHVYYNAGSSGSWQYMNGKNVTSSTTSSGVPTQPGPSWDNVGNYGSTGNSEYLSWDSACSS